MKRIFRLALLLAACAHREAPVEPAEAPPRPAAQDVPTFIPDADGDGLADAADPCPLEAGEAGGCPSVYGYLFLRVIDAVTSGPVEAVVAFEPVVSRIVPADDGYAGTLAPGEYRVRAEAAGYEIKELVFQVEATQKVVVELRLVRRSVP